MALKLDLKVLGQIPLLQGLDPAIYQDLAKSLRVKIYPRSSYVMHKGDRGDGLFLLLQGRLLVLDVTPEGRQTGLNFLVPGDFFGELALIDELPRSASVLVVANSIVASIPKDRARQLFYETPAVAERMLQHLTARLRATTDFRSIIGIPNAFHRVFALIKLLAKPDPGQLLTIENMPTHTHLALMANTSRETVSRSLHVLTERGAVEKDNRRLIIRQLPVIDALLADANVGSGANIHIQVTPIS